MNKDNDLPNVKKDKAPEVIDDDVLSVSGGTIDWSKYNKVNVDLSDKEEKKFDIKI